MRLSSIAGGQIIHSQCRRKYATRCSGRDTGLVRVRVRVRVIGLGLGLGFRARLGLG